MNPTFTYDADDKVWIGEDTTRQGCIAWGKSLELCKLNLFAAVLDYDAIDWSSQPRTHGRIAGHLRGHVAMQAWCLYATALGWLTYGLVLGLVAA